MQPLLGRQPVHLTKEPGKSGVKVLEERGEGMEGQVQEVSESVKVRNGFEGVLPMDPRIYQGGQ